MCMDDVLSEQKRASLTNEWREWRLENILPDLMREMDIDMWLVINREWIEDPVFFTLVDQPMMGSPGCVALFFHDQGIAEGVRRYSCSPHGRLGGYEEVWTTRQKTQFEALAEAIKRCNPRKIGINVSQRWGYGDGLTASLRDDLASVLGAEYSSRLVSAGDLCVRWLETRSPRELRFYEHACRVAHGIINEVYSNSLITPGATSLDELVWWTRQRITDLGLRAWFQPSFSIRRSEHDSAGEDAEADVIRRGDLIHCDVGIEYCGLCTDMQWWAYVCRAGEHHAPAGLEHALKRATQVADIFLSHFREGKAGRDIAEAAFREAESCGLKPHIYSHPVGVHGHGAGTTFNTSAPEKQDERNVLRWDYPLHDSTCYAIELSCVTVIPEWGDQEVRLGIEETAVFAGNRCTYIDGHQTEYILIK